MCKVTRTQIAYVNIPNKHKEMILPNQHSALENCQSKFLSFLQELFHQSRVKGFSKLELISIESQYIKRESISFSRAQLSSDLQLSTGLIVREKLNIIISQKHKDIENSLQTSSTTKRNIFFLFSVFCFVFSPTRFIPLGQGPIQNRQLLSTLFI